MQDRRNKLICAQLTTPWDLLLPFRPPFSQTIQISQIKSALYEGCKYARFIDFKKRVASAAAVTAFRDFWVPSLVGTPKEGRCPIIIVTDGRGREKSRPPRSVGFSEATLNTHRPRDLYLNLVPFYTFENLLMSPLRRQCSGEKEENLISSYSK